MFQPTSLEGMSIVVTGAARGIGRAIVERILSLGGKVVAVDLDRAGLDELSEFGRGNVLAFVGDVRDQSLARDCVEKSLKAFSRLDGLVNNAGILRPALIEKMTMEQWHDVIEVCLTGTFVWTQVVGSHLKNAGEGGAIVNVSSDAGRTGAFGQINYAAAKAGILGMTMTTAREWASAKIRCNSVCFGVIETDMTETVRGHKFAKRMLDRIPFGRWGQPHEAAEPVCFLLSPSASYITGQHLSANGGMFISVG